LQPGELPPAGCWKEVRCTFALASLSGLPPGRKATRESPRVRYVLYVVIRTYIIDVFLNHKLSPAGLDYRRLTDESLDPLVTLQPVLTSQNVLSISKLANRLPVPGGGGATVSPSAVHAAWLQKLFWKGDPQLLKRPPQSEQEYLHAYDTCAKYLERLVPADAVRFLDAITFSPDAAEHVSPCYIRLLD